MIQRSISVALIFTLLLFGCSNTTTELEDSSSSQDETNRIISLDPSSTEILYAIGAGDRVIAVDSYSDYPTEAPSDSNLDAFNPDLEVILNLDPDLVILGFSESGLAEDLADQEIEYLELPTANSLEQMYSHISELGLATEQIDEAAALVAEIRKNVSDAKEELNVEGLKVYHEVGSDNSGFYTNHSGTFTGDIYTELGFENIVLEEEVVNGLVDAEVILDKNPDLIVTNSDDFAASPDEISNRPGWEKISAVENTRLISVDTTTSSRSGPRIIEFIDSIVKANESVSSNTN